MASAAELRGSLVDTMDPAKVIFHFYGPSGGVYGSVPRDVLTRWMSSEAYAKAMSGSAEELQRQASAAVITITRRERPSSAADNAPLAAILAFTQATQNLPRQRLPEVGALLAVDGGDEVLVHAYTRDEQALFTERWQQFHEITVGARERSGATGVTTITVTD